MWIVSPLGVPTILRCWSARLTWTRRLEYFSAASDEGFASTEYCVEASGSTTRVFRAPKTCPAGSWVAQGMDDRKFGFDEEKFFTAQADGEPTAEERRRGEPGPSQEVFGVPRTVSFGRVFGVPRSGSEKVFGVTKTVSAGEFSGVPERHSADSRVAHYEHGEDWLLEAMFCIGLTCANAWADSSCHESCVAETSSLSTDFSQEDLSSSDDD
eukprot:2672720-Amphidinium_carterae.1